MRIIKKPIFKTIVNVFLSFFIVLSLTININISFTYKEFTSIKVVNSILNGFDNLSNAFFYNGILFLFIFAGLIILFKNIQKCTFKIKKYSLLLSVFFSLIMIVGKSFMLKDSFFLVYGNTTIILMTVIRLIGYTSAFYLGLCALLRYLLSSDLTDNDNLKFINYSKRSFFIVWGVILLFWSIYIIIYYPGTLGADIGFQLTNFYGYPDVFYNHITNPISSASFLNNHHPIFHTMLIGYTFEFGKLLGSQNIGIFIYTFSQALFTSALFAFSIIYFSKFKIKKYILVAGLILFSTVPFFPYWAINMNKNPLHAAWFYLFVLALVELTNNPKKTFKNKWWMLALVSSIIMQMLTIKYGVYVVFICFIPIIIKYKEHYIKILCAFLIPILLFQFVYTGIMLPLLGVSEGGKQEMFSLPFQQTARYIKNNEDSITSSEIKIIDKVLEFDKIVKNYDPQTADPMKFEVYRVNSSNEDIKEYLLVWGKQFFKDPESYISAMINLSYGFFYPGDNTEYAIKSFRIRPIEDIKEHILVKNIDSFEEEIILISKITSLYKKIPLVGLLVDSAFYIWIVFISIALIIFIDNKKWLIVILPIFVHILVLLASPVNNNSRYVLPIMYTGFIIVCITYVAIKEKNAEKIR